MAEAKQGVKNSWELPDALWKIAEPLIQKTSNRGAPTRVNLKLILSAIFYVLRTGCQWRSIPRKEFGVAPSTVHYYHRKWSSEGIFENIWNEALLHYDELQGLDWQWQSGDGAMTKAPLGSEAIGPNPTDRGKQGTKRSLVVDGNGIPLAVVPAGANRPDMKLLSATLAALPDARPPVTEEAPQNICLDKGYDAQQCRQETIEYDYTPHIRSRGEEQAELKTKSPKKPKSWTQKTWHFFLQALGLENLPETPKARRWVVERTHSWLNRFRKLLVRFEKTMDSHWGLLQLACAYIVLKRAGIC